jgi:hypothetical protein
MKLISDITRTNTLKIEYLLLFLLAMDFLGASNILVMVLLVYIFFKMLVKNKSIIIDVGLIALVFFSISYFTIYSVSNSRIAVNIIYYVVGPIGLYIVGQQFITKPNKSNSQLMTVILVIGFGYFIHGALNMYLNVSSNHLIYGTEILIDVWSNSPVLRTLQGIYFTIISSLLFVALFVKEQNTNVYWRILTAIASLFSILSSFILGNRTLIAIVIITFICSGLMYMLLTNKKSSLFNRIVLLCAVLVIIIIMDVGGVKNFILESRLLSRFAENRSVYDSSRWEFYGVFFKTFYQYPFGINLAGKDVLSFPYMHNAWLDVYIQAGIIPFTFFIVYTLNIFYSLRRLIRSNYATIAVKLTVFSVYIGILTNFMVEPILIANIYYFMTLCLLTGMVKSFIHKNIFSR